MSANQSYLSNPKYGYDFVVATTQASINSGLKEYLNNSSQPETIICFLADQLGNPTTQISLTDLMTKTGGINPFDIPSNTAYNDPRITTLTQNMFVVGLKIKMGLPPGVMPKDMPPIVSLGSSANNVGFNLFCSEFTIIQNSPPSGFGGQGSWNVWSQPQGTPWYFSTTVNLLYADIDNELNTTYFNNHPDQKQALINQLKNLGSNAFSLQQLLFDLDNAALESIPTIEGMVPGSNANLILGKSFLPLYFASAKAEGTPVLAINAVVNTPDTSSLRLTGVEREVNQLLDGNGVVIPNPTPEQTQVTTLNYLCAANNNPLPGVASFNWNWVDPADVNDESGVIAVNRNTIAKYFQNQLMPIVSKSCVGVSVYVTCDHTWAPITGIVDYSWTLSPGKTPKSATISPSGETVLTISFDDYAEDSTKAGATSGELKIWSNYDCNVKFVGNQITVTQELKFTVYTRWDATGETCKCYDKTITDVYTMSVGQNGQLQMSAPVSTTTDSSESPDRSWLVNLFTNINDITNDIKKNITGFANTEIADIPGIGLSNFVFPGAKVFTYKDVQFSDNQDMVSLITYVTPN